MTWEAADIHGSHLFQKPSEKQSGKPTYRSPTKASLARSYPHLVPTASAVPDSRCLLRAEDYKSPRKNALDRSTRVSVSIDGEPPDGLSQDPRASPPEAATATSSQPSPTIGSDTNVRREASPTKPDTPQNGTFPQTPAKRPRHSPEYTPDGEPRLPSTPTQLGLEPPPKPPSGLLSSRSPRKTPRSLVRPSSLSSPLKRRNAISASVSPSKGPRTTRSTSDNTHIIDIPSPDPALEVQLRLIHTNDNHPGNATKHPTITTLSPWAAAELTPLLLTTQLLPDQDLIPSLQETVAQYWILSTERARCWARCESAVREILLSSESSPLHAEDAAHRQLLGRQHLVVQRDGVTLAVRWQIVACPEEDRMTLRRRLSVRTTVGEGGGGEDGDGEGGGRKVGDGEGGGGEKGDGKGGEGGKVGEGGKGKKGEVGGVFEALMERGMDVKEAVEMLVKTLFL
ncbi:MAG: hypothetical protein LQ345_003979 [Seirophora villosa]|nr:MAG: hypothetical protein LQ345_003979 [Seirophora villosa]